MASVLVVHSGNAGEAYAQYFRAIGIAADGVHTPEEAFVYIDEHPPVVIVTDNLFRLSGYDGPAFIRSIRKRKDCALTSIIVISGHNRSEQRQQARFAGADLFLGATELTELQFYLNRALSAHSRRKRPMWRWRDDSSPRH